MRITGLTYRQLTYWDRIKTVKTLRNPKRGHFSFRYLDPQGLVECWILSKWKSLGVSIQEVNTQGLLKQVRELVCQSGATRYTELILMLRGRKGSRKPILIRGELLATLGSIDDFIILPLNKILESLCAAYPNAIEKDLTIPRTGAKIIPLRAVG